MTKWILGCEGDRGCSRRDAVLGNKRQCRALFQGTATPAKWFIQWKWTAFLAKRYKGRGRGMRSWDAVVGCAHGMRSWMQPWEYCAQNLAVKHGGEA